MFEVWIEGGGFGGTVLEVVFVFVLCLCFRLCGFVFCFGFCLCFCFCFGFGFSRPAKMKKIARTDTRSTEFVIERHEGPRNAKNPPLCLLRWNLRDLEAGVQKTSHETRSNSKKTFRTNAKMSKINCGDRN